MTRFVCTVLDGWEGQKKISYASGLGTNKLYHYQKILNGGIWDFVAQMWLHQGPIWPKH